MEQEMSQRTLITHCRETWRWRRGYINFPSGRISFLPGPLPGPWSSLGASELMNTVACYRAIAWIDGHNLNDVTHHRELHS